MGYYKLFWCVIKETDMKKNKNVLFYLKGMVKDEKINY